MMKRLLAALLLVVLASPAVGQTVEGKEISELDAVVTPADDDLFVTDQDGSPEYRKVTRAQIVAGVLALLQAHEALTSGAHGITAYGATLAAAANAAAARTALELGTAATSDTGDFEASGAVAAHEADTTSVHGIADTSVLVVDSDLGTAAALDVPATGDAAVGEVVKGSDTRLTDARTPTSHNHAGSDVTSGTVAGARLGLMVGDSGAGGSQGAVSAPAAGDAAANKFWHASGSWQQVIAGIGGSLGSTDNCVVRQDGTGGSTVQCSTVYIADGPNPIIQLGGTTSSYPGLARSGVAGTEAVFVTADGGAEGTVRADQVKLSGAAVVLRSGGISGQLEIDNNSGVSLQNIARTEMRWLNAAVLVEANTAGSGAPNVLSAGESGTCINNNGATGLSYQTLPAAAAGLTYCGCVTDSDGLRFTAVGDDTIRSGGTVTGAAGYMESTQVGDCWELRGQDSASWYVTSAWPPTAAITLSAP